jgi:type I restriction enzyme M protein
VYQHLMDYWAESLQDDAYLIAADGWVEGAQPREILQVMNKDNKLVWPESHEYLKGRRRFKSDLLPASILIAHYFTAERDSIDMLDQQLVALEQQLNEMLEENGGEDCLLAEVIEGEGDKQKITAKAVKAQLREIGNDPLYADEHAALEKYVGVLEQQSAVRATRKAAQDELDSKIAAKYPTLTEAEIKAMVVDDKWMARVSAAVQGEIDHVSRTLTGRILQLAERYAAPLPKVIEEAEALAARVNAHLEHMGAAWR